MKRRYSLIHFGGAMDGHVQDVKYMTEFDAKELNDALLIQKHSVRWVPDEDDNEHVSTSSIA